MLRKRGVDDVNQLQGGIHRYLEVYPDGGFFKGKNFVFDKRIAISSESNATVGHCAECHKSYDQLSGSKICTVSSQFGHLNKCSCTDLGFLS